MNENDWQNDTLKTVGMMLNGDRILRKDETGERIKDNTFLVLFNAFHKTVPFSLPSASDTSERGWSIALNANREDLPEGTTLNVGDQIEMPARSVWVLKERVG